MASLPSSSRVFSTFVCHNPQCRSRRKSSANERGYTMHFQKSPACFDFVRQETMQVIPNCKCMHTPANDITVSSSKKASVLRCEMVNNTATFFPATFSGALNDGKIQRVNITVILLINLILRMMTTMKPTITHSMTQLTRPEHMSY